MTTGFLGVFTTAPARIQRDDVVVMQQATVDGVPHIQLVDTTGHTYGACTPLRDGDDPEQLALATLPGGPYLRGRIVGEPPQLYAQIGPGMAELERHAEVDSTRPLVEYYRRHTEIELRVPVTT